MNASPTSALAKVLGVATVLARWTLGAFFVYMGARKALAPVAFLELLREYDLVHNWFALNAIASALPWFEIFCGFLLLAGIAVRGTALLVAAMLAFFTCVVLRRALALETVLAVPFCAVKFDCGCGGGPEFICAKLRENALLLGLAFWLLVGRGRCVLYQWPRRPEPV